MRHFSAHIARTYPFSGYAKATSQTFASARNALRFSETLSQVVNIGWKKEISDISNFPRHCDPLRIRSNGAAQKEARYAPERGSIGDGVIFPSREL